MGTLTMRPSVRWTCIISSPNLTLLASAVVGLYARRNLAFGLGWLSIEMLMPRLQKFNLMFSNNSFNLIQLVSLEAIVGCQCNWVKPEFRLIFSGFDMDVWRLFTFVAEEIKAVPPHM